MEKRLIKKIAILIVLIVVTIILFQIFIIMSSTYQKKSFENIDSNSAWNIEYNSKTVQKVGKEIKELLLMKKIQYPILEKNKLSSKYDIEKIIIKDLKTELEKVYVTADVQIISSMYDGKEGYIWLEYSYCIFNKQDNQEIKSQEGIERIFIVSCDNGKKSIQSIVEVPNMKVPFYNLEKDLITSKNN